MHGSHLEAFEKLLRHVHKRTEEDYRLEFSHDPMGECAEVLGLIWIAQPWWWWQLASTTTVVNVRRG